jgi:hypothetical protein
MNKDANLQTTPSSHGEARVGLGIDEGLVQIGVWRGHTVDLKTEKMKMRR